MAHHHHVYSAENVSFLESGLRKLVMNPAKMLAPLVREGMTVLDVGCGPGLFTFEAARLAGREGRVIAADLQQAMLDMVQAAAKDDAMGGRITLHKCSAHRIGVTGPVDLILAIHVVHELPDPAGFFSEMKSILSEDGLLYLAEPAFVVSGKEFSETLNIASRAGFQIKNRKRGLLSRIALLAG